MSLQRTVLVAAAVGALLPACNPYRNFSGEFYAGPIDPTNFATPMYTGVLPAGGTPDQSGGVITPNVGSVAGAPVSYYFFPFPDSQVAAPDDMTPATPLTIGSANLMPSGPTLAYVFDPTTTSAFPSPSKCVAPPNYVYDQRLDAYRKDQQGTIFTLLPDDPSYLPIVAEDPVVTDGEKCQSILSESAVTRTRNDINVGDPDKKYLAWAIIDPGCDVLRTPSMPDAPGDLGPIHLGFWNHYLVAYIDGGYIPTIDVPVNGMVAAHTDLVTQRMYVPNSFPGTDMSMNAVACPNTDPTVSCPAAGPGNGFDLLEGARGDSAYSPVCEVWSYDPDTDQNGVPQPETDVSLLSPTEQASAAPSGTYVYCFQVE